MIVVRHNWIGEGHSDYTLPGSFNLSGDGLTYEWDFDGDGLYGEAVDDSYAGDPDNPTHSYTASYHGPVMGWHCCPGVPGLGETTAYIDCSGFVTQVLRRLARCDGGTLPSCYPLDHIGAVDWRNSSRVVQVTLQQIRDGEADLRTGDILVWMDTDHVGIFVDWVDKEELKADTIQSYLGNGPGCKEEDLDDNEYEIEGRRWVRDGEPGIVVFHSCL